MKILSITSGIAFLLLIGLLHSCEDNTDAPEPTPAFNCATTELTYEADIRAIVQSNCATPGCHVSGFANGDFTSFDEVQLAVNDGSFRSSVLVSRVMPPSGPLSQNDRDLIDCWLEAGAPEN